MVHAQLDSFNLANYRLPDIRTHLLDFSLTGNGITNRERNFRGSVPGSAYSTASASGSFQARYTMLRNSESYQGNQKISLVASPVFSDNENARASSIAADFNLNSENRFYSSRNRFIQVKANLRYKEYLNKQIKPDSLVYRQRSSDLFAEVELLAGKGRIEPVQDARLAVYILEDLQKAGRLGRRAGEEDMLAFARLISETRSRRFFDSRDKLIWELETLNGWLDSTGLLGREDAVAVTRVYDNWLYANGPVRESGRRFSAGIVPTYIMRGDLYLWKNASFNIPSFYRTPSLRAVARWQGENPVSLHRQTGYLAELGGSFLWGYAPEGAGGKAFGIESYLSAKANRTWGWYPNSRTGIRFSLGLESGVFKTFLKGEPQKQLGYDLRPDIGLNVNYYISPQIRANLSWSGTYSFSGSRNPVLLSPFWEYTGSHRFEQQLGLYIWYSLF